MARLPRISVIVVSHGRPGWLARCISSLEQLDYPSFEIIVAADTPSLDALSRHSFQAFLKTTIVDETNISVARNAGLDLAAGELVAFLDDDAVAEPLWLLHHARAFQTLEISGSVGFVRGRNGISYQSAVTSVDAEGETHQEPAGDGTAFIPRLATGRALKLIGTNCVFRRECLDALGGFDPAYRFFNDDADLSLRLMRSGRQAAAVPLAQVHHSFAPSVRRTRLRSPRDLTEIGRSTAIYAMRYRGAPVDELKDRLFARERHRLIEHMVRGTCEPRDVAASLKSLASGWREGAVLAPAMPSARPHPQRKFSPAPARRHRHFVITSRYFRRRRAVKEAKNLVKQGYKASVFSFSLTIFRHHVRFLQPGIWLQSGGQFGRSVRSDQRYRWCRFADRLKEEIRRVAMVRGIGEGAAAREMDCDFRSRDNRWQAGPGAGESDCTARKGSRDR